MNELDLLQATETAYKKYQSMYFSIPKLPVWEETTEEEKLMFVSQYVKQRQAKDEPVKVLSVEEINKRLVILPDYSNNLY